MSRVNRSIFASLLAAMPLMLGGGQSAIDESRNSELSFRGGGWDLNGPAISGTEALGPVAAELDTGDLRIGDSTTGLPHGRRGGWDGNGPAISGAEALRPTTAELDLDNLSVEAVTPPKG